MKPSLTKNNSYFPYLLLIVQPVFMATNLIIARGAVDHVPPISLAKDMGGTWSVSYTHLTLPTNREV